MKTITQEQMEKDAAAHGEWVKNHDKGARLDWSGCNLPDGATLSRANLSRANLYGATLSRANLSRANLYGATLYGANLYGANLDGATLYGATLDGANLDGAKGKVINGFEWTQIVTMAHIDGSMRQIALFTDGKAVMIKAGCFFGTPDEFTKKAASEGKHIYAAVVPATCEAWLKALAAEPVSEIPF